MRLNFETKGNYMSLDFGWDETQEKKKYDPVPTGVHTVEITGAMLDSTTDKVKINWEFTVIGGPCERRKIWYNQTVTPKSKYFVNRNLAPFGQKADKPSDIADILPKLLNEKCEINLTYRDWTNPEGIKKQFPQIEINNWLANFDADMQTKLSSEIPF